MAKKPSRQSRKPGEIQILRAKLRKISMELCRQSVRRQKIEKENFEKLAAILGEKTDRLGIEFKELGEKFGKCCTFRVGPDEL
jgi:hypothetical protein